ncbi:MAG: trimethylamine methyltransferase family protein [Acidobacteriia bacterium]|nr:trimethylamine methyltransferase family protein [Terriglobia bacterium]
MQPKLEILERELIERILGEALALIAEPGVKVQAQAAVELLAGAGARVEEGIAHIPEALARQALASAPREFFLHNRGGEPVVRYGGDAVQFDPGSSCVHILDPATLQHRMTQAADLVRLVQVAEMLPQYAAQSTAVVCNDVPKEIGDLYRLFLVLLHSNKPIVTGAFAAHTVPLMIDLLAADSGGREALRGRPRAVFDVCPSPPLNWSDFAGQNLADLARAGVPAEVVSVPLAGAAAPVTLAGTVVQHAAECISGIVIHQLAQPGAPVVWGGAPAIFDMRSGITAMGAVETAMLNVACAQVGKHLGLPTHGYLTGSDAKVMDAQAGLESGVAALMGALGGINMISGAGMLDSLACHSPEKLVLDAETIAMAQRVRAGIQPRGESLALAMFAQAGLRGEFLKLPETRRLFRSEQHLPSSVIDRGSLHAWEQNGAKDMFARARERVTELLAAYRRPALAAEVERELKAIVGEQGRRAGMEQLPGLGV